MIRPKLPTARRAFWNEAGTLVDDFYHTQPYVAAFLTCSVKASAADWVAQSRQHLAALETQQQKNNKSAAKVHQEQPSLDIWRNFGFILYGGVYQGVAQNFLFNHFYPQLFGHLQPSWLAVAAQVSLDTLVTCPLVCLPLAYVFKALFTAEYPEDDGESTTVRIMQEENEAGLVSRLVALNDEIDRLCRVSTAALDTGVTQYRHDVMHRGLLGTYWSLWVPVQTLTFSVVPPAYRIVFVACVSFFWVAILSSIISNSQQEQAAPPQTFSSVAVARE